MRKILPFLMLALILAGCNLPVQLPAPAGSPSPVAPGASPAVTEAPGAVTAPPEPTDTAVNIYIPEAHLPEQTGTPQVTQTEVEEVPVTVIPETQVSPTEVQATEVPPTEDGSLGLPDEAILILEPGPGSRVTSPVRVAGLANPTFEQTLGVRIVLDDGTELAVGPAMIEAELGERGPFEVEVPFSVAGDRQAFIQVFDASARDGGIIHLSSVGVTLAGSGEEQIVSVEPHPERIVIFEPRLGDQVSGGVVHVEGFALASFEQHLLVEVLDADGNVVGSQAVTVQAPDLGQPGPYSADIPYQVSAEGPGRIVVHDPSAAFTGDNHLNSVEITLAP